MDCRQVQVGFLAGNASLGQAIFSTSVSLRQCLYFTCRQLTVHNPGSHYVITLSYSVKLPSFVAFISGDHVSRKRRNNGGQAKRRLITSGCE